MVTAMANEFMSFVAGFQGVAGATGGNALADSITSAFFDIAETLAKLFDSVLAGFSDFAGKIEWAVRVFNMVADIFTFVSESLQAFFNSFETVGNLLAMGIGKLLEGIGSWVNQDLEEFGRSFAETAEQAAKENGRQTEQNLINAAKAARDAVMGRQPGQTPSGTGPASQAVQAARERFANIRTGPDPEAEAEARRNREIAAAEMQRQEMLKRRLTEWGQILKDAASAQKDLEGLIKERNQLEAERAERINAPTPENQAVIDRFLSRGPQLDVGQRTAAATEKLAELNIKIKEKQDAIVKAAEQTAKNTANMFGIVVP
jgi:hypothetical protein